MNDYTKTLPPVPDHPESCIADCWSPYELSAISAYGHACAEHVRAPLLARIAELERSLEESESCLDNAVSKTPEPLRSLGEYLGRLLDDDAWPEAERYINAAALSCDRLRAEVEALRAASVIEWEPGRSYTAAELLRRVISNTKPRKGDMLWPAVMKLCGVGSTVAHYLCRWAGRDPDTGKEIAARKGEGSEG